MSKIWSNLICILPNFFMKKWIKCLIILEHFCTCAKVGFLQHYDQLVGLLLLRKITAIVSTILSSSSKFFLLLNGIFIVSITIRLMSASSDAYDAGNKPCHNSNNKNNFYTTLLNIISIHTVERNGQVKAVLHFHPIMFTIFEGKALTI